MLVLSENSTAAGTVSCNLDALLSSSELTKKYLEVSKTVSDSQIPDLATREQYNQK